mmetsp:Transcript_2278/g.3915  ORF Transcript_2278/g.3915 Transcript_2278/m.3915 type:complete len:148 (-) Transcript_2278:264-707(-)
MATRKYINSGFKVFCGMMGRVVSPMSECGKLSLSSTVSPAPRPPAIPGAYRKLVRGSGLRVTRLRCAMERAREQLGVAEMEDSDDMERQFAMESTKQVLAEYRALVREATSEVEKNEILMLESDVEGLRKSAIHAFRHRFNMFDKDL